MPFSPRTLLAVAASFCLALILTPLVRALARRFGFVAVPKTDRWHKKPTAMLGGAAQRLAELALGQIDHMPFEREDRLLRVPRLAKALQRWNESLESGFRSAGFPEVRPSYGSVPAGAKVGPPVSFLSRRCRPGSSKAARR